MARSRRMGMEKALSESAVNSLMTAFSLTVVGVFFSTAFEVFDILNSESIFMSILLLDVAIILLLCTIISAISKVIADSVAYAFAKKSMTKTNSGAEYFLREMMEQFPLIIIPSSIAAFLIGDGIFSSDGTLISVVIGILILILTVIACSTKAISDGIATGLLNAGALEMFSNIKLDEENTVEKENTVVDSNGYEWYEADGESYYRKAGMDQDWILFEQSDESL
jgi:hypothetical protein